MKLDNRYLRHKIKEETFEKSSANQQLSILLTKFMVQHRAVGLAANQVGYNKRVFVMHVDGRFYSCFNPSIIESESMLSEMPEGCLSFPKEFLTVARPGTIVVQYYDYQGNVIKETLGGLAARCFQHELDHLNGITMHQRLKENTDVLAES